MTKLGLTRGALFVAVLTYFPFVVHEHWILNIAVFTLMYAGLSSAWNLVGGYAGYPSLGHAAFFGAGAYIEAIWFNHHSIGSGYLPFVVLPLVGLVVMVASATAILPIFAKDVLLAGPLGLGILRSAPAIGALVVGTYFAWYPIERRAGLVFLWSLAGYGVATALFGASANFLLSTAALMLYGATDQLNVIVQGDHNTVVVSSNQTNSGTITATTKVDNSSVPAVVTKGSQP